MCVFTYRTICVVHLLIVGIVLAEAFGKGIADDLQLCHLVPIREREKCEIWLG